MENERVKPTPPSTRVIKEGEVPPRGENTLDAKVKLGSQFYIFLIFSGIFVLIISLLPTRTIFQGVLSFAIGVATFLVGFGFGCWYEVQRILQREEKELKPKEKKTNGCSS